MVQSQMKLHEVVEIENLIPQMQSNNYKPFEVITYVVRPLQLIVIQD